MKVAAAYFVGTNRCGIRPHRPAEIVGVRMVRTGDDATPRPCFELRWPDGLVAHHPIDAPGTYRIESRADWDDLR